MDKKNITKILEKIIDKKSGAADLQEIDSLNKIKILMKIEKKFQINFDSSQLFKLFNKDIKNIAKVINKNLSKKSKKMLFLKTYKK
jgi:acyl carrier protein